MVGLRVDVRALAKAAGSRVVADVDGHGVDLGWPDD
jgi:hypothetical protein